MNLSVFERLILLNILPAEGDFLTMKIIRDLKNELGFSEEEYQALRFTDNENGNVRWVKEADIPKEISIGEIAHGIIKTALSKLNDEKKLTEQHIPIYERFVLGVENG